MNAIMNGGAIPEVFDYKVKLEPEGHFIGTLNEDFAIESLPGRRVPARQYVLAHPRHRQWRRARRGRAGAARPRCRSGWERHRPAATR
jgi:hypothetical protein